MAYVEMGEGDPIVFQHGNPTSSYLWRNVMPHLADQGRCVAVDLIGMGDSDKLDNPGADSYRYTEHRDYLFAAWHALGVTDRVTLVIHDWGSALGFHYAMRHESNVKGIAFLEAIIAPVPDWEMFIADFKEVFQAFRTPEVGWEMIVTKNMFVEEILPAGVVRKLTEKEMNHYREPFRDPPSRKPVWRWPNEIPIEGKPADVVKAVGTYNGWLQQSKLPKLLFYATPGALLPAPMVEWCLENLSNLEAVYIGQGTHFLQEDQPHLIGSKLATWYRAVDESKAASSRRIA